MTHSAFVKKKFILSEWKDSRLFKNLQTRFIGGTQSFDLYNDLDLHVNALTIT